MTGPGVQTITARDGRALAYAEWGAPSGQPVFSLHGTPGCRLNRHPNSELLAETGARIVTFDRPGYGRSDRLRGRTVVDVVADVEDLASALGFDEFGVVGGSGGGPHALAVAARLGDRVSRAACIVSVAPYDVLGDDWMRGMDPLNVREFSWAVQGEDALFTGLSAEDAAMRARVAADPATVLGDFALPDADRKALSRPEVASVICATTEEQTVNGVWGWVDDDLAITQPWGFDAAEVKVPTAVWWGDADVLVPPHHGEWLAANLPTAVTRVSSGLGHAGDPDRDLVLLYAWLLDGSTDW